jgi:transposase
MRLPSGVPHDACSDPGSKAPLRYRHLLVRQMVQMKNRVSGLLMETGVECKKQRLHKVSYFRELLSANGEVHPSIRPC